MKLTVVIISVNSILIKCGPKLQNGYQLVDLRRQLFFNSQVNSHLVHVCWGLASIAHSGGDQSKHLVSREQDLVFFPKRVQAGRTDRFTLHFDRLALRDEATHIRPLQFVNDRFIFDPTKLRMRPFVYLDSCLALTSYFVYV